MEELLAETHWAFEHVVTIFLNEVLRCDSVRARYNLGLAWNLVINFERKEVIYLRQSVFIYQSVKQMPTVEVKSMEKFAVVTSPLR